MCSALNAFSCVPSPSYQLPQTHIRHGKFCILDSCIPSEGLEDFNPHNPGLHAPLEFFVNLKKNLYSTASANETIRNAQILGSCPSSPVPHTLPVRVLDQGLSNGTFNKIFGCCCCFLMWTFGPFVQHCKFVTTLLLFYVSVFWPPGMWDLGSPG